MSGNKTDSIAQSHNEADEVYSGYLCKSPPSSKMKIMKTWKRRFFVLTKTNDSSHELKYYKTTERDRAIKSIPVSTISLLYIRPESHSAFEWICKNFRCSASSVLFMKAEDPTEKVQREYFFIGDRSEEVDKWFKALSGVTKNIKSESQTKPQITAEFNSSDQNPCDTEENTVESRPPVPPRMKSASKGVTTQHGECSQPPKNSPSATEETKTAEDSNEDTSSGQSVTGSSEGSLLDCVTKALDSLTTQTESDSTTIMSQSISSQNLCNARNQNNHSNGNCASNKMNSETHTLTEKEICVSHRDLKSLIFTEEAGKPCVSKCQQTQDSCLFHKGDQILAVNDLLTDTVEEMHTYLRRLSKDKVTLTIRRLPGSVPLHSEPC
ncbi:pleckstrin homology domain-containing family S member 1 isoform X1 [Pseudorasbora parva]|uniref:pleckstrin homology domain-containing family S member 1 isoform X1 n=1 Tax=Pseudorasbora parva TaxID=51549 RepID=UPI00351F0495